LETPETTGDIEKVLFPVPNVEATFRMTPATPSVIVKETVLESITGSLLTTTVKVSTATPPMESRAVMANEYELIGTAAPTLRVA
jgi:hypothetical protein